jgi:RHS repeat-associated protein
MPGGVTYAYTYNAAKRVTTVQQNNPTAGSYAYDFQGARVWRRTYGTGGAQTAYIYDESGHLLAEHNAATGAATREYVWIDDVPVALINISGATETTDFIHTGQIDEPLAVTSSTQALVWNAYIDPFGTATTFTTPSTTLDMRLPGQSFQLEMNSLHQNRWRDYDPSLGRYIEADPLGIDAGQNVYAYVDGDPVNLLDKMGLGLAAPVPAWGWVAAAVEEAIGLGPEDAIADAIAAGTLAVSAAGNNSNAGANSAAQSSQQAEEYNNYKNICNERPPPNLCGDALLKWQLEKAKRCMQARQEYADKYFNGNFDRGHATQMQQLQNTIYNLTRQLNK